MMIHYYFSTDLALYQSRLAYPPFRLSVRKRPPKNYRLAFLSVRLRGEGRVSSYPANGTTRTVDHLN